MSPFEKRLRDALAGSPLEAMLTPAHARFAERRGGDAAAAKLGDATLRGLARLLAPQPDVAGYLANRPGWLARAAELEEHGLDARSEALSADATGIEALELEEALDALRLRRRDEMALAACAELAGLVDFEQVSVFLSRVAESTARAALALAQRHVPGPEADDAFAVVGMGKIAGREFTYHSDLDLIFLFRGSAEEIDRASRIGQRLISYLTTLTGAGIAYAVDTRLRPSGQQGMLVASFDGYERYQIGEAATWEHLAMLRARPIAGALEEAAERLAHVRARVVPSAVPAWPELAGLRQRVVEERARGDDGAAAFKTGAGGLMDADFLAGGGLLERGAEPFPDPPSVAAMLRAAAPGPGAEALLADYRALRRVEACARWAAGRAVEALPDDLAATAELLEPGLAPDALRERVARLRRRVRAAWERVIQAGSIEGLELS